MTVAILGAGATGLTCAYLLLREGVPVRVYEAAEREGGLGGSFRRDGFTFDFGPHEFCTQDPELLRLLEEVCGDRLMFVEKDTAQHFRGAFVRYPLEVADVLRSVGPGLCARALVEVAASRLRRVFRRPQATSFEAWTREHFGSTLYEAYFRPYTRKVWGVDPALLDPRAAEQRISVDSVWHLLWKTLALQVLGAEDYKRTHSEYRRGFHYTRGGFGELQGSLRRRVEELGGRILTGHRLTTIERAGERVESLGFANGARASGLSYVVSTIPLPLLTELALGERGRTLNERHPLAYRGLAFVFLRVARSGVLPWQWTYFPEPDVPFQRITAFDRFGADMCPEGRSALALEIAASPGEPDWESSPKELVARSVEACERIGFLRPGDVLGADVVRVRHGYPLQLRGFLENAEHLLDALTEASNLVTLGRQGLFRYCNTNECMEMAIELVPRILAGELAIRSSAAGGWRGVAHTDRYVPARAARDSRGPRLLES